MKKKRKKIGGGGGGGGRGGRKEDETKTRGAYIFRQDREYNVPEEVKAKYLCIVTNLACPQMLLTFVLCYINN